MIKADKTVVKETLWISAWICVLSVIMQAVFIFAHLWSYKVLLGNLLGAAVMILNFFFMGITVQQALGKDEADAKKLMKLSQSLRTLFIFVCVVLGVVLPCFSTIATIIPLFFPRIAVALRPLIKNKQEAKEVSVQNEVQ
ncbi:MAG: ATP synthase subunit I [Clostridia bacterium]|nr:ATP synthase subunit I [Clostridia bacterium]